MKHIFYLFLLSSVMACHKNAENSRNISVEYPKTSQVYTVDDYFGVQVKDPYRWLEDDMSDETAQWVKAENDVTFSYLKNIPYRDELKTTLEKLMNYEKVTAPFKEGE